MDIRKVKKLIELLDETGVAEIEIKEGEESVRISRHPSGGTFAMMPQHMMYGPPPAPAAAPATAAVTPAVAAAAVAAAAANPERRDSRGLCNRIALRCCQGRTRTGQTRLP